jgi:hypothetical protein
MVWFDDNDDDDEDEEEEEDDDDDRKKDFLYLSISILKKQGHKFTIFCQIETKKQS